MFANHGGCAAAKPHHYRMENEVETLTSGSCSGFICTKGTGHFQEDNTQEHIDYIADDGGPGETPDVVGCTGMHRDMITPQVYGNLDFLLSLSS